MAEKQKHVVNVTISDPDHTMVSKRKEKISRRATVSADSRESAIQGAIKFYRKQGLKVHDHDYVGLKEEVEQTDEAIKPKSKEDEGEYGYEGDMAMSQLRSIIRNSQAMLDNLDEKTDLPEWVQSKITLAKDYIETSANYLMSELEEEVKPDRRNPSQENQTRRAFIDARKKKRQVNEGLVSGALKVAGKVFNAPAYTWAGEKLEKRERIKKMAAEKAARKAKRTAKKAQTKDLPDVSESASKNEKTDKILNKYKGIRNRINTKPELEVSLRNTSPTIMGNVAGHEGQKPNANI